MSPEILLKGKIMSEDVQRPKAIDEAVENVAKEVKEAVEAVEALNDVVEDVKEQTSEPEPEIQDPTEHYRAKKGITITRSNLN